MFSNHLHMPFRLPWSQELRDFYFSFFLRNFAIALIAVFEPIYLYLFFDKSVPATLLFLAAAALLFGLLAPVGGWFAGRVGEKHAMLYAAPLLFAYYLVLWNLELLPVFLVPLSMILLAVHNALFWPAFHFCFLRISNHGRRGKEFGWVMISSSLAVAVAPFLGGVILSMPGFGFPALFMTVLAFLLISGLVLLRTQDVRDHVRETYRETFSLVLSKPFLRQGFAFAAQGGESVVAMYMWPLFLFALAFSFERIGLLASFAAGAGIVVVGFLGSLSDRVGSRKVLRAASVGLAAAWVLRVFTQSYFGLFALHTFGKFFEAGAHIPFMSLFYERASDARWRGAWFLIFREVTLNTTRAFILLAFAAFFSFSGNLQLSFIPAAFFALLLNVIR